MQHDLCLFGVECADDFMALMGQQFRNQLEVRAIVVHDQNARDLQWVVSAASRYANGRITVKVLPSPTLLST